MRTFAALLLVAAALEAQQPRLTNAKLETRSAAAGLGKEFQAIVQSHADPVWAGYSVKATPGEHNSCCYSSDRCCGGCALEGGRLLGQSATPLNPVRLEGPGAIFVLFRVSQRSVDKIHTYSPDCELDAGGLPFFWLTDVRPAESIALLTTFATASGDSRRRHFNDSAIAAIAQHSDPAADAALERLVAPAQPEWVREKAAFWLGSVRGRPGYEVLKRLVTQDASDRVREKAIFALSVSREPEAVTTMIDVAKTDKSPRVRGQALFWLGHKAGKKETEAITDAIESDPDTEVKKKAVFALSQLPKDEGIPLLIQVARTNRNPAARKQAMFWLGQSRDPRALQFFEQVLTK